MSVEIIKATTKEDLNKIADLAYEIWNEYFINIISQEQIDYMLLNFQSLEAIVNQTTNDNYTYFSVYHNAELCGYMGIKTEKEKIFLSKLYLHEKYRGQGIASSMFQKIFEIGKKLNKKSVYLTVNKNNIPVINIYKFKGFEIVDSVVTDIGEGYVMDDYIMECRL